MNNIISKISQIETAAADIMESAAERKKEYERAMAERSAAFDRELEEKTAGQLKELRAAMEQEAQAQLDAQRREASRIMERMEEVYQNRHVQYVEDLFRSMTKE